MTPIVAKEIRLLLPAYGMALLLAIVPMWLLPGEEPVSYLFCLGAVLLALSSFGREFALGTFPLLLTQPLERSRIWWSKIGVLAVAMITVMAAWLLSCANVFGYELGSSAWSELLIAGATATVLIFSGGLWSTLLLRQIIAAFWFTVLVPGAIVVASKSDEKGDVLLWPALALYSIGGFLWAWRQFLRAQETGWSGGVISFSGWKSAHAVSRLSMRSHRPIAALFWKELQLHQVGLVGMAGLFALHLVIVILRTTSANFSDTWRTALEVFGGVWLIVPILAGSTSVAEERKLDTHQGQLCLPISSRLQFGVKLLFALVIGGLLSPLLLFTAEGIGRTLGVHSDLHISDPQEMATIVFVFLGLSLVSFYASTVARHVVQSLAVAVASVVAVSLLVGFASRPIIFGLWLWYGNLVYYIIWPTLVLIFTWLASRNFHSLSFLRRNVFGLTGALLFIVASTSALYHRAWELIIPAEPAHGPARLLESKQTKLDSHGGFGLAALLPDGRLWVDRIAYDPGRLILAFGQTESYRRSSTVGVRLEGRWLSLSGNHILPGSNWVDTIANFRETVAIRSDGTLWVSEKPRQAWDPDQNGKPPIEEPAALVQFGSETNWQSVTRYLWDKTVLLLKHDGTLWRWSWLPRYGKQPVWPGYQHFEPHLLKAESKWTKILAGAGRDYGWQADGRGWVIHQTERAHGSDKFEPRPNQIELEPGTVMERMPSLDNTIWRGLASYRMSEVGLREDGTLWTWRYHNRGTGESVPSKPVQVGQDKDWVAVAGLECLAALKADGSLWRWNLSDIDFFEERSSLATKPPVRLGTHNDWIGVGSVMGGIVSLAADGSLWYWWDRDYHYPDSSQPLLAASRRPSKIENILGN